MPPPHVLTAEAALHESQSSICSSENVNKSKLRVPYDSLRYPLSNLRVNKWDALILDSEILELLKTPMKGMFSMFEPASVDRFIPEIDAALQTLLFVFATGLRRPTPGMKLEYIQYAPHVLTGKRIVALFLLSVGMPFVWKRLCRYLSSGQNNGQGASSSGDTSNNDVTFRDRILVVMKKLETVVAVCRLVNLLVFLRKGTYRSLPERCLGMKLKSIGPSTAPRLINFEYMTRQLLWDGLMELGNFFLPLVTWSRRRTRTALQRNLTTTGDCSTQCCLCGISPPETPYITSCKHVYCYYCLQTAVAMEEEYRCVACGIKFDSSQRWQI